MDAKKKRPTQVPTRNTTSNIPNMPSSTNEEGINLSDNQSDKTGMVQNSEDNIVDKNGALLKPNFDMNPFSADGIKGHLQELLKKEDPITRNEILRQLLEQIKPIDFWALAGYPKKMAQKYYLVPAVEQVLKVAAEKNWALCKNHDFIYLYNGAYWEMLDKEIFVRFLGEAAEKMSVSFFDARHFLFRDNLFKQFLSAGYLPAPEPSLDSVLINLKNGTFEVTPSGTKLRPFDPADFITYQLPFEYNPDAKAPLFEKYLNRVLPDKQRQLVLAEYLGFTFMKHGSNAMKEEKALICFGGGANGKSVLFEVAGAMFGSNNVSNYTLQSLTNENGYFRAKIANKLVNYASEISGTLNTAIFKQMVSGEPVEARLPYGQPFTLAQYAKLIFNCNELPKEVEHTNAYFRRFLIIPFDVTIPVDEQDKQLHLKIIDNELSGVFNWVLEGLARLLKQKRFSECDAAYKAVEKYKLESDTVGLFIEEGSYNKSNSAYTLLKQVYIEYRAYCNEGGYKALNKSNFRKRLESLKISVERKNIGIVVYLF